ncbi:hypothetical protein PP1Y_Lpl1963 (plasmid) [Novosphingobium sp. PP1Y]|nr:hypothetical protein PP1Y_Lpl1963 [Novosphingobium sp. PP1Y]
MLADSEMKNGLGANSIAKDYVTAVDNADLRGTGVEMPRIDLADY